MAYSLPTESWAGGQEGAGREGKETLGDLK